MSKKFEGMVFAIDFDGTCVHHEFPAIGEDSFMAVATLKWISREGGKLVLNTMRSNCEKGKYLDDAVRWFADRKIPLYGVNKNPDQQHWTTSPKVYANIYIDDAALGCPLTFDPRMPGSRAFVDWIEVGKLLALTPQHETIHK